MTGDKLPHEHHIARYCGRRHVLEGQVLPSAFHLRLHMDEQYLSVQWLEYLRQPDRTSEVTEIRRILASKLTMRPPELIAVLNIGETINHIQNCRNLSIKILHEPEPGDPSHSGIHDTIQDEIMIAELIVERILETYPAVLSH